MNNKKGKDGHFSIGEIIVIIIVIILGILWIYMLLKKDL
jgi:hypothetical protein